MAKLVDAVDSKSTGATHAGSSPALGTKVLYRYNALEIDPTQSQKGQVLKMFWIVLILFVISSLVLTAIILLQEAKQGGLERAWVVEEIFLPLEVRQAGYTV